MLPVNTIDEEYTTHCDKCHFMAGEIAGMVSTIITHPLDTVKTQIQAQMINNDIRVTHNTVGMLRHVMLKDGIPSIYKGILFPFFGNGAVSAVVFGVNNISRIFLLKLKSKRSKATQTKQLSLSDTVLCGGFTGFCASFLATPIERIKIWSQSHKIRSMHSVHSLHTNMGIRKGYFGGFKFTAYFQILTYSVYFPIYELSLKGLTMKKDQVTKQWSSEYNIGDMTKYKKKPIAGWKTFIAGGVAGVVSWVVGYPLDTLKTRIQSGLYNERVCIESLKRHYAVGYYGMAPAIYRAALLHSSLFLMYEKALQLTNEFNHTYLV